MSDDRDVLRGYSVRQSPHGSIPTDPAGQPVQGRRLAGQNVEIAGVATPDEGGIHLVTYAGQLLAWSALSGESCELVLHFRAALNGQALAMNAGGMDTGTGTDPSIGYLLVKYGIGATVNTIMMDAKQGAFQLPPCDFVSVDIYALTYSPDVVTNIPPLYASAALAQGTYPGARPATWTRSITCALGDPDTFTGPAGGRAVELIYVGPAVSAPGTEWVELNAVGSNNSGQRIRVSLNGASSYPLYMPVPVADCRVVGGANEWSVEADNTVTPLIIFYLAF